MRWQRRTSMLSHSRWRCAGPLRRARTTRPLARACAFLPRFEPRFPFGSSHVIMRQRGEAKAWRTSESRRGF